MDDVQGFDAQALRNLVPYWFDDRFDEEREAGIVLGVEDAGALIDALLGFGAANGPDAEAAGLIVEGAPGLDDEMVGVLTPEQVQAAAEFLSRVPVEDWAQRYRLKLADAARQLGYSRPFDDGWANHLVEGARELAVLFQRAADRGEAVIVVVSA